jgi:hypothetical protein
VLKGDLVTTPLPQVLRQLADSASSGCLHVLDARGEDGRVYLRGGLVYAVQVPGQRPLLGQHLVSSGSLGPEMLAEALEAQRTELQGWKLGELLVHLGYVDAPVVEDFLAEQLRDQAGDLLRWPTGTWKFRVNERAREDVARPTPVEELLDDCERRSLEWESLVEAVHGPEAVPVLSAAGNSDSEMAIDPEAWSLLCKVDGERTLSELALECGFTLFEAGRVVHTLVRSGLLEVEEPTLLEEDAPVGASVASRLTAAFSSSETAPLVIPHQAAEPSPADVAHLLSSALTEERSELADSDSFDVEGSIDRISAALSAMLGPTTDDALFAPRPRRESKPAPAVKEPSAKDKQKEKEKAERDKRRRAKDAEELAIAQATMEAERRAAWEGPFDEDHEAEIVSLADVRREAARREEEEARASEQALIDAEAVTLELDKAALAADRAQHEADTRAAEEDRLRAAEEARLAQSAATAEAERLAEEARLEEQRLQEESRVAEEERLRAAEEARLAEARERLEQEKAALAAERALLEEEVRKAQEQAEAARLAEEARLAEAESARLAEEARLAEQARLDEEARLAAEAEAARLAEEASLAAEAEAARLAEAESARLAEEARLAEQARLDEEARLAAEAEAARLAEEALAAEARLADEARLAAEQARIDEEGRLAEEARYAQQAQLAEEARIAAEATERAQIEAELRRESAAQAAASDAEQARAAAEEQSRALDEAQALADAQLEEQTRAATQRTAASAAFAELSAAAASAPVAAPVAPTQVVAEEPAHVTTAVEQELDAPAASMSPGADTDMASLFRELSSLGQEDEPAPATPRPPARTSPAAAQAKKKKGLFGR